MRERNRKEMSEVLDRAKARRTGQRGVVTKYDQEVRVLVEVEPIEPGSQGHLNMLLKLLEEKQGVIKALDDEIVATCPADNIKWEVGEAEEVYEKIVESLTMIECVKLESTVRGEEIGQSDGDHSSSHEPSITHDSLIVHTNTTTTGTPVVL